MSLARQKRPCAECPFRMDVEPGQFPRSRYEALRESCRHAENVQAPLGAPMFACHKSPLDGPKFACAGWLAVEGRNHITVRLALALDDLPVEALSPGEDWPALFETYEEMANRQGGDDGRA